MLALESSHWFKRYCADQKVSHNFSVSTAVTLKIRSRSPIFVMSKLYNHANLVRIQSLVHMILYRQENLMPKATPVDPVGSTLKTIPAHEVRGHNLRKVCSVKRDPLEAKNISMTQKYQIQLVT